MAWPHGRAQPPRRAQHERQTRVHYAAHPMNEDHSELREQGTGPLALVGGGEFTEGCTFDRDLVALSGGTEIALIPTAAAYEGPGTMIERATEWFRGLGATVNTLPVYERHAALDTGIAAQIANASFVYLASGSAMHLLSVIKRTPLWAAVQSAHERGAVVAAAGSSASVLCDAMVDPRGGGFGVGVGMVTELTLIPRYDQWSVEKARRTIELAPAGLALAGIPERTALIRTRSGWAPSGVGIVRIFKDGQPCDLSVLNAKR